MTQLFKKTGLIALVFMFILALPAYAKNIAVLDMQLVMNETSVAKEKQDELKKRSEEAQKKFTEMEEAFKKRVEDLERKKSILSEEKYLEEQGELRRISREHQSEIQIINEKLGREYKRIQKEISDEVDLIVEEISKEKGYDLVLVKSYLLYASKTVDITDEVLKRVDVSLKKKRKQKGL